MNAMYFQTKYINETYISYIMLLLQNLRQESRLTITAQHKNGQNSVKPSHIS